MGMVASQITSPKIVYSTVYSLCGEFTGEFPAQRASDTENIFIWWRHHVMYISQAHVRTRVYCIAAYYVKWL